MSESVERVTTLLDAALLGNTLGEPASWDEAQDSMWSAIDVIGRAERDIRPADLTATARAFRVMAAAEEWARAVVNERRFYEMSRSLEGAPTLEWEAAALRLSDAEAALLTAVLGETEGAPCVTR